MFKNDFKRLYFCNRIFLLIGVINQSFDDTRQLFCRTPNLASFGVFRLRFASKFYILEAIESWQFFDPNRAT